MTCTITNDDVPAELTLVKDVVNDNGGHAPAESWTLFATGGPTPDFGGPTGSPEVTGVPVLPGDYDLSESFGPPGYAASAWSCEGGSLTGSTVTVALGESVSCTITNDDQPAFLTLVKTVNNGNGGTAVPDWTLSGVGPTVVRGVSGTPEVTQVEVLPGTYHLLETGGPSGYQSLGWQCSGGARPAPRSRSPSGRRRRARSPTTTSRRP